MHVNVCNDHELKKRKHAILKTDTDGKRFNMEW